MLQLTNKYNWFLSKWAFLVPCLPNLLLQIHKESIIFWNCKKKKVKDKFRKKKLILDKFKFLKMHFVVL